MCTFHFTRHRQAQQDTPRSEAAGAHCQLPQHSHRKKQQIPFTAARKCQATPEEQDFPAARGLEKCTEPGMQRGSAWMGLVKGNYQ